MEKTGDLNSMTIISHKFKLIHFHNPKCGGTSFEVALSKYLGNEDVISVEHEHYRRKMGYKTAQNHLSPGYQVKIRHDDLKRILINIRTLFIHIFGLHRIKKNYQLDYYSIFIHKNSLVGRHNSPEEIKNLFPNEFENYKKICVIRNPIDQFISFYRYRKGKPLKIDSPSIKKDYSFSIPFDEFVILCAGKFFNDVKRISGLTDPEVNNIYYIKYESFEDEIGSIIDECNIPNLITKTYRNTRLRDSDDYFPKPIVNENCKKQILQSSEFLKSFYSDLFQET